MPNEMPIDPMRRLRALLGAAQSGAGEILNAAEVEIDRLAKVAVNLMGTNEYTGVPTSGAVQAAEDAARIVQLQRDVDYWRGRAETAEEGGASQAEMRYHEGYEAGQKDEQDRRAS